MNKKVESTLRIALLVLLVVWGGYTMLAYLGVPVHLSILVPGDARTAAEGVCSAGDLFCFGRETILSSIKYNVMRWMWADRASMYSPFFWYTIIFAIIYACFLGWNYVRKQNFTLNLTVTPLRIIIAFIACLWLMFTTMSMGASTNGQLYKRVFEPQPQLYNNISTEALEELTGAFNELKERNCLTLLGQTAQNVNLFDMKASCMQWSFISRVLMQFFIVLLLIFEIIVLGRFILHLLRIRPTTRLLELVASVGLGTGIWMALLWLTAAVSLFTAPLLLLYIILIPIALYKHSLYWLRVTVHHTWNAELKWSTGTIILAWLLLSYLALNFITVIRPFPIGWDDLGVYLNKPRSLAIYGSLIPQMGSFQWEYISALGFSLLGTQKALGATTAMVINWAEGLFALLAVMGFTHIFLRRGSILAGLLYYTLPLVGHFSFADMKIDNAVFAMASFGMIAMFIYLFPEFGADEEDEKPKRDWKYIVLSGLFCGFAFGMKVTSTMAFLAIIATLFGVLLSWPAFIGGALLGLGAYAQQGQLGLNGIADQLGIVAPFSQNTFALIIIVLALIFIGLGALYKTAKRKECLIAFGLLVGSFLAAVLPWLLYNNISYGNIVPSLITGPRNTLQTQIDVHNVDPTTDPKIRRLPPELAIDINHEACSSSTAKTEELDRYWGFRTGIVHYATLPWRSVMNLDSAGYYVTTMSALLLIPLVVFLPFFWRKKEGPIRYVFGGTIFILIQWMFLANGIPWYGLSMFLGLTFLVTALAARAPDNWTKGIAAVFIAFSLMTNFANRDWQYGNMSNLYEYALGKINARAMEERTIPHYNNVRDIALERAKTMDDRPYVYRMGTFIPYFLPRNFELLPLADNQLDLFKCIHQEKNNALTLRRLQALGFNSMIFDTNTHTIERNPNGTLHQKVAMFLDFVNDPSLGLNIAINDPSNGIAYILLP